MQTLTNKKTVSLMFSYCADIDLFLMVVISYCADRLLTNKKPVSLMFSYCADCDPFLMVVISHCRH